VNPALVILAVGLSPALVGDFTPHLKRLAARGGQRPLRTVKPAVTCSVQSTLVTGIAPSGHGVVANGWYFRELSEVWLCLAGIGAGFFASYLAVVQQIGEVSSGGYFLIFWMFQNPPDLLYSVIKGMAMATVIVLVGCYYGYNASGGPVGVGTATAKSMVLNIVLVHLIGMLGTQLFWGANPRAPIGG
jgi:hypothetical protein